MKKIFIVLGILLISQCVQGITPINEHDDAFDAFRRKSEVVSSQLSNTDMALLMNKCQENRKTIYKNVDCDKVFEDIERTLVKTTTKKVSNPGLLVLAGFQLGCGMLALPFSSFWSTVCIGSGTISAYEATFRHYISPEAKQQLIDIRDNIKNAPSK